jgi:hypothetical protein
MVQIKNTTCTRPEPDERITEREIRSFGEMVSIRNPDGSFRLGYAIPRWVAPCPHGSCWVADGLGGYVPHQCGYLEDNGAAYWRFAAAHGLGNFIGSGAI